MEAQMKGNHQVRLKPVPKQNASDAAQIKAPKLPKCDRDEPDAMDSQIAAPNPIALNLNREVPKFQQGRNHNSSIVSKFDPDSAQFAASSAEKWEPRARARSNFAQVYHRTKQT
jgi:hypothetical protein